MEIHNDPHKWEKQTGYETIDVHVCKVCFVTKVTDRHGLIELYPKIHPEMCSLKHTEEVANAFNKQLTLSL